MKLHLLLLFLLGIEAEIYNKQEIQSIYPTAEQANVVQQVAITHKKAEAESFPLKRS